MSTSAFGIDHGEVSKAVKRNLAMMRYLPKKTDMPHWTLSPHPRASYKMRRGPERPDQRWVNHDAETGHVDSNGKTSTWQHDKKDWRKP